jgi:transcription elongation factor Elf1
VSIFDALLRGSIVCDNCGRRFREHLYDEPQKDGGLLRKFQCPRCGQEYPVARYSREGRDAMEALQRTDVTDRKKIARLQRVLKREVRRP